MKPFCICHSDFALQEPINVFHKENVEVDFAENDNLFLNRHIIFRKKAVLPIFKKAAIRITADDYYKLYINGKFVTQGPAPSYPGRYYYNEVDVTDFLCEGENTFAVHTYYQGLINRVWVSGDRRQMLWFSLEGDGESLLVSDKSWRVGDHTAYFSVGRVGYDTAFLEGFDSRAAECKFFEPTFDDSAWSYASVFENADYTFEKQPTKQLDIYDVPPSYTEVRGDTVFVDFGREMVGYPKLRARGRSGDTIELRFGEELNTDGTVRFDMRCNCRYLEQWILSGGDDALDTYDYKAYRYMEIVLPKGAEVLEIGMTVRHYPYSECAEFSVNRPELLDVINLCRDTVKYGTQELYLDCPTREKGQYLGDLSISARAHAVLTGDTALMKKAVVNFLDSSFICNGIMAVSVSSLMQEIADYSLQLSATVAWIYSFDGDVDFVRYAEPYLTGIYEYFKKYEGDDGLLYSVSEKWNLVDWPDNLRDGYDFPLTRPIGEGAHNVLNAFWCGFLDSLEEIYAILRKSEIGASKKAKESFCRKFYSEKLGLFCDSDVLNHSSVHSNALPLLFEIGTEDERLVDRIADFIKQKGLTSMGVYMAYFTLAALVKHGKRELAEELAASKGAWLNMLSEGATTTFEAWGKDQKWNTSLFHPWATAPIIIFAKNIRVY